MMSATRSSRRFGQSGMTMFGLLFWAMLIGFTGYLLVRILPTMNEYYTIQRAVDKVAGAAPATVVEARSQFDKQKEIEYSIEAVTGKDLEITKENDKVVIRFAYNKEVPIYGNVFVLIKYQGRSK
jgi:Domain of unknown function (DUF4845)